MKKVIFPLGVLALSATLLLSSCGGTGSGEGRAADNGNISTPASAAKSDMNGSVGNGGTSTDPAAAAGEKGIMSNNGTPGDVGSDASGTHSRSMSGAGTNSSNGMGTAGAAGSNTNNSDGAGGAGKGKTGTNPGAGKPSQAGNK